MLSSWVAISIVFLAARCLSAADVDFASQTHRDPRFFFLKFQSTSTCNNGQGACMDYKDCIFGGGQIVGICSFGLMSCCYVSKIVGSSSAVLFYMTNPTNPSGDYAVTAKKTTSNTCQIRLDFLEMTLDEPDRNGVCSSSFFQTSVSGVPIICGENAGQHMYINYPSGVDTIDMNIVNASPTNKWNIKVTQIECGSTDQVPQNCLQWFNASKGTVKSFNYQNIEDENTYQLANQDYLVCIKSISTQECIIWKDSKAGFSMSTSDSPEDLITDGDPTLSKYDADCTSDYVTIPDGKVIPPGAPPGATKFCGQGFPDSVQSSFSFSHFYLGVTTDGDEGKGASVDYGNNGFSLDYSIETGTC